MDKPVFYSINKTVTMGGENTSSTNAYLAITTLEWDWVDMLEREQTVLACISFVAALFVVMVFIAFPRVRIPEYKLVFCLALSDLGLCVSFFLGSPLHNEERRACVVQGFIMNLFSYSSVFFATIIGAVLYKSTVYKIEHEKIFTPNREICRVAVGFGVPILLSVL